MCLHCMSCWYSTGTCLGRFLWSVLQLALVNLFKVDFGVFKPTRNNEFHLSEMDDNGDIIML